MSDLETRLRAIREEAHTGLAVISRRTMALEKDAEGSSLGEFLPYAIAGIRAEGFRNMDRARKAWDRRILAAVRELL